MDHLARPSRFRTFDGHGPSRSMGCRVYSTSPCQVSWLPMIRLVLAASLFLFACATQTGPGSGTLPGLQVGPAPWLPETGTLRARLAAIGLPALEQEGTLVHTHQHLDIVVNGRPVEVPANVGINQTELYIAPIHTHDETGILHVESDEVRAFTLGQFFDIWGVRFTAACLGAYCADERHLLRVYVNG